MDSHSTAANSSSISADDLVAAADSLQNLRFTLHAFREERRYTQRDIADMLGCHRNTIQYFERGDREISMTLAAKMMVLIADELRAEEDL